MNDRTVPAQRVPRARPSTLDVTAPVQIPSPPVIVASVPANHVYVRHIAAEDDSGAVRLPDPVPSGRSSSQQWWPPVMLEPGWVGSHDFDIFHLHFGFDAQSTASLENFVEALRKRRRPFVFTVHDLRNPHHVDRQAHDDQLDVLIPAADRLITLTAGAAREIGRRWGRDALVLPHPHVVPFPVMRAAQAMRTVHRTGGRSRPFRVGLHLKSLRASMNPRPLVPTLVEAVSALPDAVLQVNIHRDVLEGGSPRHDAGLAQMLRAYADRGLLDLRVHDYLSDQDLWTYLASLDVSVLPYRFGTHSGWLEACRDLGTAVIAPTCGYFADQAPVGAYRHDEEGYDADSLAAAIRAAHGAPADSGPTAGARRQQRARVAAAHDRVYRSLIGAST